MNQRFDRFRTEMHSVWMVVYNLISSSREIRLPSSHLCVPRRILGTFSLDGCYLPTLARLSDFIHPSEDAEGICDVHVVQAKNKRSRTRLSLDGK
jgi:hypothetical protein